MATEVNFTPEILGLSVNFTNTSPTPTTSWEWDFGDNTPRITDENPSHTYTGPGRYTVVFVAVGADGPSSKILTIDVLYSQQITIEQYLVAYMPIGLTIVDSVKDILKRNWQINISELTNPAIPESDVFNELAWPILVNSLLAKLIIRDAYMKAAAGALVLAMGTGTSTGNTQTLSSGAKKSIETGPTKVEWHDASSLIKSYMNAGATKSGSLFDMITSDICSLSSRLRIQLPFCDRLKHSPIVPIKVVPEKHLPLGFNTIHPWHF